MPLDLHPAEETVTDHGVGTCATCGDTLDVGATITRSPTNQLHHLDCVPTPHPKDRP